MIVTASPVVQAVADAATAAMTGPLSSVAVLGADDLLQAFQTESLSIAALWDPDTGGMSATGTVTVETTEAGLGRTMVETTRISCIAHAGSGDVDLAMHRDAVNAILSAFRDGLRAVTDVGGSSAIARIDSQEWAQIIDENGSGVVVAFDVIVMVLP